MDAVEYDLRFLASSVKRLTAHLRTAARRVGEGNLQIQRTLCAYIEATVDAIDAETLVLEGQFPSATTDVKGAIVQQLRFFNLAARALHETTPWLASLRSPRLRLGISYFLSDAALALLRAEPDLILNPDSSYMYSTLPLDRFFRSVFTQLRATAPTQPAPIVISYPDLEEDATLLHPVFVHELGHDAVDRFGLRDLIYKRSSSLDQLNDSFADAVESLVQFTAADKEPLSPEEAAVTLRKNLNSWLEELCCDHLAFGYLGASYLFAATTFLFPVGMRGPSATHPPSHIRTQLLLEMASETGWVELLLSRNPEILAWLQNFAAVVAQTGVPAHVSFMEEAVVALGAPLREVVSEHLGSNLYPCDRFSSVADELHRYMSAGVLPAQLEDGSFADRRAILIAGWLHHLQGERDRPEYLAEAVGDVESQRFLAKALEMSVVLERWRQL